MIKYHIQNVTPLAFHNFFRFFSLPVGALLALVRLVGVFNQSNVVFNSYSLIDVAYYILAITLSIVCIIGFINWKPYAWQSVMVFLVASPLYCLIILIIYLVYLPSVAATVLGQFIGVLIYGILVGLYYLKRKPLFKKTSRNSSQIYQNQIKTDDDIILGHEGKVTEKIQPAEEVSKPIFCRKCGVRLPSEDSIFCTMCGTKVL